uniref:Uncharacterized protein n=1 Tax=Mycena chlorophos TaxID=658473 RepID=A0ABQ0L2P6_MYCCL|nr:predicted protein [Mycena chlorophos]
MVTTRGQAHRIESDKATAHINAAADLPDNLSTLPAPGGSALKPLAPEPVSSSSPSSDTSDGGAGKRKSPEDEDDDGGGEEGGKDPASDSDGSGPARAKKRVKIEAPTTGEVVALDARELPVDASEAELEELDAHTGTSSDEAGGGKSRTKTSPKKSKGRRPATKSKKKKNIKVDEMDLRPRTRSADQEEEEEETETQPAGDSETNNSVLAAMDDDGLEAEKPLSACYDWRMTWTTSICRRRLDR